MTTCFTVCKVMTDDEIAKQAGKHFEVSPSWHVVHPNQPITMVRKSDGSLLCALRRHAIDSHLCQLALECYGAAGEQISTNRGFAAGVSSREQKAHYQRGAPAQTGVIGYIDSSNSKFPCRLTQYSRKYFDQYQKGLPFIERMDVLMQELVPEQHRIQKEACKQAVDHENQSYTIQDTAFSTVTVNKDFRTALHMDSGDYRQGFGTIAIISNKVSGGWLLFPQYQVAFVLESGDFAAVDVHEWHCNSPIVKHGDDAYRYSFIAYFRERLMKCSDINRRLSSLDTTYDSTQLLHDIFGKHSSLPVKQPLADARWWMMENEEYRVLYKGKRYTFMDKKENVKIYNLWPAWEYVNQKKKELR